MFWRHVDWNIVRPFLVGSLIRYNTGCAYLFRIARAGHRDCHCGRHVSRDLVARSKVASEAETAMGDCRFPAFTPVDLVRLRSCPARCCLAHWIKATRADRNHGRLSVRECQFLKSLAMRGFGFDYRPYLWLICCALLASLCGTWLGKRMGENLPEKQFRIVYRVLITVKQPCGCCTQRCSTTDM